MQSWYYHRLRAMSVGEIFGRVREKILHVTEKSAHLKIAGFSLNEKPANVPSIPDRNEASEQLRETLASDAASLLKGEWKLYGWQNVHVSTPPNWHRDYANGVDVPSDVSLNHRALPKGGDVRSIWEINRWAEIVRLGMHGFVNVDANAIVTAQDWLGNWIESNPSGKGLNWSSALEAGLRLINFCGFDALVRAAHPGAEILQRQDVLVNQIVPNHVWWVHRYLSFGSSANNHRLGELTGLLLAIKRWPELEKISAKADVLWKQTERCILQQFAQDGGNKEQALHYHLFAFEMALHACRAMKVMDGATMARLQKAAEFFVRMTHPQQPWEYGDNDDAQIVPVTLHREKAVAEWWSWMQQKAGGETLRFWLGASFAQTSYDSDWWLAKESGMAFCEHKNWKLRADASPLGFGKLAAHGHADALHVSLWDDEKALIIDPGTGGYFAAKELRTELAEWKAHNGPQPAEGFKTPLRIGTFLWSKKHRRPEMALSDDGFSMRFEHEGHGFTRTVKFMENGKHVTVWDMEDTGKSMRVDWTFAPECKVKAKGEDGTTFEVEQDSQRWSMSVIPEDGNHEVSLRMGRVSRSFGLLEACWVIEVTAAGWLRTEWHRL